MNLGLADEKTRVRSGSFPAVVTKIKTLPAQTENVLKLTVGDVSVGDAYQVQPFSNTLVELQMFGTEIQDMLEGSFDRAFSPDGSIGAYPYAAGLRWHVTTSMEK